MNTVVAGVVLVALAWTAAAGVVVPPAAQFVRVTSFKSVTDCSATTFSRSYLLVDACALVGSSNYTKFTVSSGTTITKSVCTDDTCTSCTPGVIATDTCIVQNSDSVEYKVVDSAAVNATFAGKPALVYFGTSASCGGSATSFQSAACNVESDGSYTGLRCVDGGIRLQKRKCGTTSCLGACSAPYLESFGTESDCSASSLAGSFRFACVGAPTYGSHEVVETFRGPSCSGDPVFVTVEADSSCAPVPCAARVGGAASQRLRCTDAPPTVPAASDESRFALHSTADCSGSPIVTGGGEAFPFNTCNQEITDESYGRISCEADGSITSKGECTDATCSSCNKNLVIPAGAFNQCSFSMFNQTDPAFSLNVFGAAACKVTPFSSPAAAVGPSALLVFSAVAAAAAAFAL